MWGKYLCTLQMRAWDWRAVCCDMLCWKQAARCCPAVTLSEPLDGCDASSCTQGLMLELLNPLFPWRIISPHFDSFPQVFFPFIVAYVFTDRESDGILLCFAVRQGIVKASRYFRYWCNIRQKPSFYLEVSQAACAVQHSSVSWCSGQRKMGWQLFHTLKHFQQLKCFINRA